MGELDIKKIKQVPLSQIFLLRNLIKINNEYYR